MQKLTERDKKLLIFLAVFTVVVGIGAGVLLPLIQKSQDLKSELADARLERQEKEMKVAMLTSMREKEKKLKESLSQLQQEFYEAMPSMEIDKMLTDLALGRGLQVQDLNISLPIEGQYTELMDYTAMLNQQASGTEDNNSQGLLAYNGVCTASVTMIMTGERVNLQAMLDACAIQEPRLRISNFQWQKNTRGDTGGYTLAISMELYMYEDTLQYMQDLMEQDTGQERQEDTEDTEEEQTPAKQ
ncbi:hypothetical protein MCG98_10805 [Ruminococcus sp. OA3]|uniref:hypothetical protein n=1 Tax=Ruminococcus sp. OA3 TaxID=2914164 RepID=UPI001F069B8B|nr:hypothetical protein [Ruminococcus sp. OA3]MCH1983054.1 hypothetical protein [Ruminococcus sp. OA3]